MSLNLFDIGIVLILIGYIISGWKSGVVKETASFIGIVVVFVLSYLLKGIVGNFLCSILPFFKFDGLISLNIVVYQIAAFVLLFVILLSLYRLLLKISNGLQKIVNATIILIIPSKILGAIMAFVEGWIVLFVIIVLLVVPFKGVDEFSNSTLNNVILFHTPVLSKAVKPFTKAVVEIYNVTGDASMKNIDANEYNLKSLDIMLKYKITDKETVEKLIETGKLDEIKDIDSVLNKY